MYLPTASSCLPYDAAVFFFFSFSFSALSAVRHSAYRLPP